MEIDQGNLDSPEIIELSYAPAARKRDWRRLVRLVLIISLTLGVLYVGFFHVERGSYYGACAHCGARFNARFIEFFGFHYRYATRANEGPISKAIQNFDGQPCDHPWAIASSDSKFARAQYRGLRRSARIRILEAWPEFQAVLDKHLASDPEFILELKNAVQSGFVDDGITQELIDEAMMWEWSNSRENAEQSANE